MSAQPIILPYKGTSPKIAPDVFVAPGAAVIGDVTLAAGVNVWFNVTIRGDVHHINIGENTNVQDNSVIHVTRGKFPTHIGNNVTIGHGAVVHACTIGDLCLIGMGSVILDGAVVEPRSMVAAGAVVTPGKVVKSGTVWSGVPAKEWRPMTQEETNYLPWSAKHYVELAAAYRSGEA